ncbi:MarR family winged helix-turn-helix transcriptional regulator [Ileibacterium valens]|uniref:MarR family winged helix-turn-helix transcriptional regulator n=1 Tax=Ileibacterium valens TaxID=1862668 RepID=UPI002357CD50|nr:MarR family transcriptional regulator [Ileibacterium valens]
MKELTNSLSFCTGVIINEFDRQINLIFKDLNITKSQADLVRYVCSQMKKGKMVRQKDIEEFFNVSNPTVSGLINRLEAKDLLVRVPSKVDRRIHVIEPTQKAWEILSEVFERMNHVESEMLKGISPEQKDEGMKFLRTVASNVIDTGKENPFVKNSDCSD